MREHLRGILNELCRSVGILYAIAVIEGILLIVSFLGMLSLDPGSAGFVVWLLNAAGLVVLFSFTATVVVMCFRR